MGWFRRRVIERLRALLREGVSPDRLALCVAIGITIGIIPILGVSSLLCVAVALAFNLNLPAMQIVQAVLAPVQLLLIIPFVRLGEWMTHAAREPLSVAAGLAMIKQGAWHAVMVLKTAIIHAGLAWICVAPILIFILYRILKTVFARAAQSLPRKSAPANVASMSS